MFELLRSRSRRMVRTAERMVWRWMEKKGKRRKC